MRYTTSIIEKQLKVSFVEECISRREIAQILVDLGHPAVNATDIEDENFIFGNIL